MSRSGRIALWIVAGLAILFVVVVIVLPAALGNNVVRRRVERQLSARLGRPVRIGHLHVSLIGGNLDARQITIANPPEFGPAPLAEIADVRARLDFWPLIFAHRLHAQSVVIERPVARLLRSAHGAWNFAGMPPPAAPGAQIGRLQLLSGTITAAREGTQERVSFAVPEIGAREISLDRRFPVRMNLQEAPNGAAQASGAIGPLDRQPRRAPLRLEIAAQTLPAAGLAQVAALLGYEPVDFAVAGGVVDAQLLVTGTAGAPSLAGTIRGNGIRLTRLAIPQTGPLAQLAMTGGSGEMKIERLRCEFSNGPNGFSMRSLAAQTNFGTVTGAGWIRPDQRLQFLLHVRLRSLPGQSGAAGWLGALVRLFRAAKNPNLTLRISGTTTHAQVAQVPPS